MMMISLQLLRIPLRIQYDRFITFLNSDHPIICFFQTLFRTGLLVSHTGPFATVLNTWRDLTPRYSGHHLPNRPIRTSVLKSSYVFFFV